MRYSSYSNFFLNESILVNHFPNMKKLQRSYILSLQLNVFIWVFLHIYQNNVNWFLILFYCKSINFLCIWIYCIRLDYSIFFKSMRYFETFSSYLYISFVLAVISIILSNLGTLSLVHVFLTTTVKMFWNICLKNFFKL